MRLRVEIATEEHETAPRFNTHDTGVVRGQEPVDTVLELTGADLPTMARQLRALADSMEVPPRQWVSGLDTADLTIPTTRTGDKR